MDGLVVRDNVNGPADQAERGFGGIDFSSARGLPPTEHGSGVVTWGSKKAPTPALLP